MFKQAAKLKLRFQTKKGMLSVEDLYDLKLEDLNDIAIALDDILSKSPRKSFISEVAPEDSANMLRFNIVKEVISDKLKARNTREEEKVKKAKREQLEEILMRKKNAELENLSIEDLEKRLSDLK